LAWLEVECNRCKTRASLPLHAIRRPRITPIWKLEVSLKCRSCLEGRYAPPVRMIKLTEDQQITPYKWVHPDRSGEDITLYRRFTNRPEGCQLLRRAAVFRIEPTHLPMFLQRAVPGLSIGVLRAIGRGRPAGPRVP
jgi:hypothetical protein